VKVRSGFVSNSSSSSFVLIAKKEDFDKVFAEADKYTQRVIKELGYEIRKFAGTEVVVIAGMDGNYSSFEYMSISIDEEDRANENFVKDDFYPSALYYEFSEKLNQFETIDFSVDC